MSQQRTLGYGIDAAALGWVADVLGAALVAAGLALFALALGRRSARR